MNSDKDIFPAKDRTISVYMHGITSLFSHSLAERFAKAGAAMFLTDPDINVLRRIVYKMKLGGKKEVLQLDEHDAYQIEYGINKAYSFLGSFDCAINNILLPEITTNIIDCSMDFYNKEFRTSFLSIFFFIKYEISLLLGLHKGGSVINVFHLYDDQLLLDSHLTYSYLSAMKGMTASLGRTYRDEDISILSYLIQNPRPAAGTRMKLETLDATDLMTIDITSTDDWEPTSDLSKTIFDLVHNKVA